MVIDEIDEENIEFALGNKDLFLAEQDSREHVAFLFLTLRFAAFICFLVLGTAKFKQLDGSFFSSCFMKKTEENNIHNGNRLRF